MRLAWRKHRLICRRPECAGPSWTSANHRIAAKKCLLTTRCATWATMQVGTGRAVSDVASELSCDWHTVNDAVMTYGRVCAECGACGPSAGLTLSACCTLTRS